MIPKPLLSEIGAQAGDSIAMKVGAVAEPVLKQALRTLREFYEDEAAGPNGLTGCREVD